jgi:hypothetical protein
MSRGKPRRRSTCRALADALQSVLLVGHVKALRPVEWFPRVRMRKTWVVNFYCFLLCKNGEKMGEDVKIIAQKLKL